MERLKARAGWSIVAAAVVIGSAAVAQNDIEDPGSFPGAWYRIAFDSSGNYLHGDGLATATQRYRFAIRVPIAVSFWGRQPYAIPRFVLETEASIAYNHAHVETCMVSARTPGRFAPLLTHVG